jgi:hypothetical protein
MAGDSLLSLVAGPRSFLYAYARDALVHAVRALSETGARWLVPAWTCEVVPRAIRAAGGSPVYYEVDAVGHPLLASVREGLAARPGGIVIVHPFGLPARGFADILEEAKKARVPLVEDCALAAFSFDGDVALGARGDAAVFSLRKSLPVRNGGALVANGEEALVRCRAAMPSRMRRPERIRAALEEGWRALVTRFGSENARRRAILASIAPDLRPIDRVPEAIDPASRRAIEGLDVARWREDRRARFLALHRAARIDLGLEPLIDEDLPAGALPFALPVRCADPRATAERLRLANVPCGLWPDVEPSPAEVAPMRPRGPLLLLRIPPPPREVGDVIARARAALGR